MKKKFIITLLLLIIPVICVARAIAFRLASMDHFDIRYVKKQDYNQRGMHKEMAAAYEQLAKKYPERTDLLYDLGWAYYKTGHLREGALCMEKYAKEIPYHPEWQDYYIQKVRKAGRNVF